MGTPNFTQEDLEMMAKNNEVEEKTETKETKEEEK
jgi:hypothetical protein